MSKQSITSKGVTCIFPDGVKVAYLGEVGKTIIGRMTPAITYNQTIHFNKDIIALCTPETMIHESVHIFQERRMGKLSYWATYFWQILLSLFRAGPAHIHDDHLMEREARDIAKKIVAANVGQLTLDIETLIREATGWR